MTPINNVLPAGSTYSEDQNYAYSLLQSGDLQSMLKAQMILDQVNEQVTMQSNFEKSNHDTNKAAINNIGA